LQATAAVLNFLIRRVDLWTVVEEIIGHCGAMKAMIEVALN